MLFGLIPRSRFMDVAVYGTLALTLWLGGFLLFVGLRNAWRGAASRKWPTVAGVVLPTEREVNRSSDGSSTVSANVRVKYTVAGREYVTRTLHFGQTEGSSDDSDAELLRLRYPEGARVPVSYLASSPDIAAVEPGFSIEALWLIGAGVALALVAAMFAQLYRNAMGSGGGSGMAAGALLFSIVFMLIGSPMLIFGGINLYRAHASTSWPQTDGEIVYGEVGSDVSTTRSKSGMSERRSVSYGARIVFRYAAGGRTRYSNMRRFGQLYGADEEWAAEIADRYPPGTKLKVTYDPSDANLAILEPGVDSEAFWLPGAGLAFFLFGIAVWVVVVPGLKSF